MGAWIEIFIEFGAEDGMPRSHPTMGAWIEIFQRKHTWQLVETCRTPRWVRGLKFLILRGLMLRYIVAPHDGCVD